MVEIIEEVPDPSVVRTVMCRNCGRKLRYVPCDVEKKKVERIDTSFYDYIITCPGCKYEISVQCPMV